MAENRKDNGNHSPAASAAADERLDGWKRIGAYLNRSVRTVQRWEKHAGLPVYRHIHDERATPYAFAAELDAWWARRGSAPEHDKRGFSARFLIGSSAAAALVVLLLLGALLTWQQNRDPVLPFEQRDWALIAAFDNLTAEAEFDGALEHALAHELINSRHVNIVPLDRVHDALGLMKTPLDARLTPEVAREVALRDGGIRAVITGRAEKLDSTYLLSATLVEPASGVAVVSFREEAPSHDQIVPAVQRLAHSVRRGLGESLADIESEEARLERASTPSLRALRLFSEGSELKERGEFRAAEVALREAIAEDPEFASAHLWLAFALMNQRRPRGEYLIHADRALELSAEVSEEERYFIQAMHHLLSNEIELAIFPLEALLRLRPDHYFALLNLRDRYSTLGRHADAAIASARVADLRPASFDANAHAASKLLVAGYVEESRPYLERARVLDSPEVRLRHPAAAAQVDLHPAREHIANGDMERALTALLERPVYPDGDAAGRSRYLSSLSYWFEMLGRLRDAEQLLGQVEAPHYLQGNVHFLKGRIHLIRNDVNGARDHLHQAVAAGGITGVPLIEALISAGMIEEAREAASRMEHRGEISPGEFALGRAYILRVEGRIDEGIDEFRAALAVARPLWIRLPASYYLADLLAARSDVDAAVAALESIAMTETDAHLQGLGGLWIRSEFHRMQLLRQLGREEEAAAIETVLRHRLSLADEDHFIARELRLLAGN